MEVQHCVDAVLVGPSNQIRHQLQVGLVVLAGLGLYLHNTKDQSAK